MKTQNTKQEACHANSQKLYSMIQNDKWNQFDNAGLIQIVEELDRIRKLWKYSEESKNLLSEKNEQLENKIRETTKKIDILNMDLMDTQKNLMAVMEENNALKLDLKVYESREKQLKEAVSKGVFDTLSKEEREQFAFLREPITRSYSKRIQQKYPQLMREAMQVEDDSEIDYDDTCDSLKEAGTHRNVRDAKRSSALRRGRQSRKAQPTRRSRSGATKPNMNSEYETPAKREKLEEQKPIEQPIQYKTIGRRSLSCGNVPSPEPQLLPYQSPGLTKSTVDVRSLKKRVPMWTSGTASDIALRQHTFEDVGINLKMKKCDECQSALFSSKSLKCKDCHQNVHKQCASRLRVPCVPRQKVIATPKNSNKGARREYRLQDFCTSSKPMLPYPIVYCVVSLEKRSLTQEGLYRVPGSARMVTNLLGELRTARTVPDLDLQESDVITETIKRFLRELKDPLVPRTSREEFISAACTFARDRKAGSLLLNRAICELPQCNRDTMAFLFLHWRKVTSMSEFNKMTVSNMSRVLAPCVMGLPLGRQDQMSLDISNCEMTMNVLFSFDDVYWQRFLIDQSSNPKERDSTEPEEKCRQVDSSLLGPVTRSPATPLLLRSTSMRRANILGSFDYT